MLTGMQFENHYRIRCIGADGKLKWEENVKNLVTNEGLNHVLNQYLKGSAYTAAFYVGLKGTGTVVAGDTMASHSGWSEDTTYSESVRQTLTLGTVASQSVDNSASTADFSINGSTTLYGAFISTDSTKSGTSGTLYAAVDFSASRSVISGDTVQVTATFTAASA